jgi:hypothetical protein
LLRRGGRWSRFRSRRGTDMVCWLRSIGLAAEEQRERQEEQRRFLASHTSPLLAHIMEHPWSPARLASPEMTVVSDSSPASDSDSRPIPDPGDGGMVQFVSGHRF